MKPKLKLLILITLLTTTLFPQSKLHIKGQPQKLSSEIVAVRDANGNYCAAIKILSDKEGFKYESYNGVVKMKDNPGEDIVYLSADERVLQVYKTGYQSMKIILSEIGIQLEEKAVWEIRITGEAKAIPINIITEQEDATIHIDGEQKGTSRTHKVPIGKHTLKIEKEGYKSITDNVEVSESNTLFEYKLDEMNPVKITIKSNPPGATILIDNVSEGQTNKQIFKFPGEYDIKLIKSNYETVVDTISVLRDGNNSWSYDLIKTTGKVILNTDPSDANIYLNGQHKSANEIEVAPGRYKIEIKKDGYYSDTKTLTVTKGGRKEISFNLSQKTGKLQVEVEPMETEVTLYKNNKIIDSWIGSKSHREIGIGKYRLKGKAEGYQPKSKVINIYENKKATTDLVLKEITNLQESQDRMIENYDHMIFVKGGIFDMGSTQKDDESPVHEVKIDDFYISKYEVTYREFLKFLNDINISDSGIFNGHKLIDVHSSSIKFKDSFFTFTGSDKNCAASHITWFGACEFCNWKSKQKGLETCYTINNNNVSCQWNANGYRLPTEAEWEYSALGGHKSKGYKFIGSDNIEKVAWYANNSNNKIHIIGQKTHNELGLYDMSGNVKEWCWDRYFRYYYSYSPKTNPKGPTSGTVRVIRGGSWNSDTNKVRCKSRDRYGPTSTIGEIGFRIVRNY